MTLEVATEIFVQAFSKGRSKTHPYLATRHNDLWVMRDGPGKKGNPRKIEVVACNLSPGETIRQVRELNLGWHFLCAAYASESDFAETRKECKAHGYRALGTEWYFVHNLDPTRVPILESDPPVRLVTSREQYATIQHRNRQPRAYRGDESRQYCIWDDFDFGWVHSVPHGPDNWVSDLYVHQEFRGRGFGKALMSKLLLDDIALGVRSSVLVSSAAGRKIYPQLGYKEIGVLHVMCPAKR